MPVSNRTSSWFHPTPNSVLLPQNAGRYIPYARELGRSRHCSLPASIPPSSWGFCRRRRTLVLRCVPSSTNPFTSLNSYSRRIRQPCQQQDGVSPDRRVLRPELGAYYLDWCVFLSFLLAPPNPLTNERQQRRSSSRPKRTPRPSRTFRTSFRSTRRRERVSSALTLISRRPMLLASPMGRTSPSR
jgi:hypothetical protein